MRNLIIVTVLLVGCQERYVRNEQAAVDAFMNTNYFEEYAEGGERLVIRIESRSEKYYSIYFGHWGPDFDYRIGFFKVGTDGTVYKNRDEINLEDKWVVIE